MGHDFANHPIAVDQNIGVMQAVFEFVDESEWELFAITNECYSTYVLAKDDDTMKGVASNFILESRGLVEIRDAHKMHIAQVLVPLKAGKGKMSGYLATDGVAVSILTVEPR